PPGRADEVGEPVPVKAPGQRVVILGASGHVGGALAACLAREGLEVIGHSSKTLDLTQPEALGALDPVVGRETTLVFASALTPDRGQNLATFMANLTMAVNVARYVEAHPVGRCVYLGSDAVYGFDLNPVTETTPVAPGGYYALAKYTCERTMECAASATGLPFLCLRVRGVYGPGDPHRAYGPNAFARSLARAPTGRLCGGGAAPRDPVGAHGGA